MFRSGIALALSLAACAAHADGERLAFVTSVQGNANLQTWADANGLSGLAAADRICRQRATAAGLAEADQFVAWMSDSNDDAYCRVHGLPGKRSANCGLTQLPTNAGPWWRRDGRPFADVASASFTTDAILNPLNVTELNTVSTAPLAFTGTSPLGARDTIFVGCGDWTAATSGTSAAGGRTTSTAQAWSLGRLVNCNSPAPLYCLQRGSGPALPKAASRGRVAFVTTQTYSGDLGASVEAQGQTGLAAADAICQTQAQAAALPRPTTYRAWLSDTGVPAASRFANDGPWYRLDGQRIASSLQQLQSGSIETPINLDAAGAYVQNFGAWTGTTASGTPGTAHCSGWTATTGATGTYGVVNTTLATWTQELTPLACTLPQRLYCLADNDTLFADTF